MIRFVALTAMLSACAIAHAAGQPRLVADIAESSAGQQSDSSPHSFAALRDFVIFSATSPTAGNELWRSNGTTESTQLIKDINPGSLSSNPTQPVTANNLAFFLASDPSHGQELWVTDGTAGGTRMAGEVAAGPASSNITLGIEYHGSLLFTATSGTELWKSDGQTMTRVTTLQNLTSALPPRFARLGDTIYIATASGLFKTDGTASGTQLVKTLSSGSIIAAGDRLFLAADLKLWVSDGTSDGTHSIAAIKSRVELQTPLTALGNRVLLRATGTASSQLWISDGTEAGTFNLTRDSASSEPVLFNGFAYFSLNNELWRTDGSIAGTNLIKAIPSRFDGTPPSLSGFAVLNGKLLFFIGLDEDLWSSDGTSSGTQSVYDLCPCNGKGFSDTVHDLVVAGGKAYFAGIDSHGQEPWVTDGTAAGTQRLANIGPDRPGDSHPRLLTPAPNGVYFYANDDKSPALFFTNGQSGNATLIKRAASSSEIFTHPVSAGSRAFFVRNNVELWQTDGTTTNTTLLKTVPVLSNMPQLAPLYALNDHLIAPTLVQSGGYELWSSDGTVAGTISLAAKPYMPFTAIAGRGYFVVNESPASRALMITDGASARAIAHPSFNEIGSQAAAGGDLYLFDRNTSAVFKLWKSDGTTSGTVMLKSFDPTMGYETNFSPSLTAVGTDVYFVMAHNNADASQTARELWKCDGTAPGTTLVKSFTGSVASLTTFGSKLIFSADDGVAGQELWISDGTAAGTVMVKDIAVGKTGSSPSDFVVADGILYFSATDADHGRELWQSDGTSAGTLLVTEVESGPTSSNMANIVRQGDSLYFSATSAANGDELWAYTLPGNVAVVVSDLSANEGSGTAMVTIGLTHASPSRIAVNYQTVDETAKAGLDYSSASGTVTFEPGETTKVVSIGLINDDIAEPTKWFGVRLTSTATIERPFAAVFIEDDDARADLSVALTPATSSWNVRNSGPANATNVRLCYAAIPRMQTILCLATFELSSGTTRTFPFEMSTYMIARVTAAETDPQPANNTDTWSGSTNRLLFVNPALPAPGKSATLTYLYGGSHIGAVSFNLSSSAPAIFQVPATITVPAAANFGTVLITPLKAGNTTITAPQPGVSTPESFDVHVVDGADINRFPSTGTASGANFIYGDPISFVVNVIGTTYDGVAPTGTVTLFLEGTPRTTAPIVNGFATVSLPRYAVGAYPMRAAYGGDSNFVSSTFGSSDAFLLIIRRNPSITAAVSSSAPADIVISMRGIQGAPPFGNITVTGGGKTLATGLVLTQLGDDMTFATIKGAAPGMATVSVLYSGSSNYNNTFATIPVAAPHLRSVRH
jgi:ELWxxDGT repeat protein